MRLCLPSPAKLGVVGVCLPCKNAVSGLRIEKVENAGDMGVNAAWEGEPMGEARLFRRQLVPLLRDHG
jgi:hypothetical protein